MATKKELVSKIQSSKHSLKAVSARKAYYSVVSRMLEESGTESSGVAYGCSESYVYERLCMLSDKALKKILKKIKTVPNTNRINRTSSFRRYH